MYEILHKTLFTDVTKLMIVEAPQVARKAQPGQFVIVRINDTGERIPLTIADFDRKNETITLVVLEAGYSTQLMGKMNQGDMLHDVVGPLGHASSRCSHPHTAAAWRRGASGGCESG